MPIEVPEPAADDAAGGSAPSADARLAGREGAALAAVTWGAPLAVAAIVVANAWAGLMPGVGFWDTGEFQTVLPILGTAHPTGYPTYVLLGFVANILLAPIGEPAFRITVLSLLAVAAAAGLTVALARRLTHSLPIAVAAGIGLALTPLVWANATRADPHPIHLAFVALLLFTLVSWEQRRRRRAPDADRWLVASALVFGLAAGNHSLTLLLAPPIALYVLVTEPRIVLRPKLIAACAAVLVASVVLVYLELPLRAGPFRAPLVYARPDTWDGFWYVALAEQFRGSLSDPLGDLPAKFGDVAELAWAQFGLLTPIIVAGFLATIRRAPRYALLTGTAMVVTLVFNTSYANADIERYYLGPILWAWTWLAVLAAFLVDLVALLVPKKAADPPARWLTAGVAAVLAIAMLVPVVSMSTRSRLQADRSGDRGAEVWLDQALAAVAQNAVVVSWWSTSTVLWYGTKVEGLRPDIAIVDDRTMLDEDLGGAGDVVGRYLGVRPVYIIRANGHDLGLILQEFVIRQVAGEGNEALYEVTGRSGAAE